MSSALNCNRCGTFVSLATKENTQPASGWKRLEVVHFEGGETFDRGNFVPHYNRQHLCPDCCTALTCFMDNKPVQPALVRMEARLNIDLFNKIFSDDDKRERGRERS